MIIECVNIETGIFFVWEYEDMSLSEARDESGDTNIMMLKSYSCKDLYDYVEMKRKHNKEIYKLYRVIDGYYLAPITIHNADKLLCSKAYKKLNKKYELKQRLGRMER